MNIDYWFKLAEKTASLCVCTWALVKFKHKHKGEKKIISNIFSISDPLGYVSMRGLVVGEGTW